MLNCYERTCVDGISTERLCDGDRHYARVTGHTASPLVNVVGDCDHACSTFFPVQRRVELHEFIEEAKADSHRLRNKQVLLSRVEIVSSLAKVLEEQKHVWGVRFESNYEKKSGHSILMCTGQDNLHVRVTVDYDFLRGTKTGFHKSYRFECTPCNYTCKPRLTEFTRTQLREIREQLQHQKEKRQFRERF